MRARSIGEKHDEDSARHPLTRLGVGIAPGWGGGGAILCSASVRAPLREPYLARAAFGTRALPGLRRFGTGDLGRVPVFEVAGERFDGAEPLGRREVRVVPEIRHAVDEGRADDKPVGVPA